MVQRVELYISPKHCSKEISQNKWTEPEQTWPHILTASFPADSIHGDMCVKTYFLLKEKLQFPR